MTDLYDQPLNQPPTDRPEESRRLEAQLHRLLSILELAPSAKPQPLLPWGDQHEVAAQVAAQVAALTQRVILLERQVAAHQAAHQATPVEQPDMTSANPTLDPVLTKPNLPKSHQPRELPFIPLTLISAMVGAVLTYGLIQFFPTETGILSRINNRVNDIQIILQKNGH